MAFSFGRFTDRFTDAVLRITATKVRNKAREIVRVDTGQLRNSIMQERVEGGSREVSANTEYAAAQEYGRPDLPNYGFTPYMRPAAQFAIDELSATVGVARDLADREAR